METGIHDGEKILTADGKRLSIAASAILAVGPHVGVAAPREMARTWMRRLEEAAADLPVEEIWELMLDSGEMSPPEVVKAWFGQEPSFEQAAALLWALLGDRIHFSRRKDMLVAEPVERVTERISRMRNHERKEGRLESLAAAVRAGLTPGVTPAGVDAGEWLDLVNGLREVAVHGPDARGGAEAMEVLRRADVHPQYGPFDLLVQAGVLSVDENLDLLRHGVNGDFSEELLDEASALRDRLIAAADVPGWREDARCLGSVTVDSEYTVEVDDALSVRALDRGWEVGIHIADVASLVRPGTCLWDGAMGRGATLYMPDATFPMLPPVLGKGGFSLDEGETRPALSLFVSVSPDGVPGEHRFVPSMLRVERRLDYDKAAGLAQSGDLVLEPLVRIGEMLKRWRLGSGGVDLRLPETSVRLDPEGEIRVEVSRATSPSQVLVSECAILYNRLAAGTLRESGLAGIYRSQPEPGDELPDTATGGPVAELAARRMLPPSRISTEPGRHFMLGVDAYTLATSPIRRSFDLVVQHQLGCALHPPSLMEALTEEQIRSILLVAGPAADARQEIERSRKRYFLLRYLAENVAGRVLAGVVVDRMSDRIIVHLLDFATEVALRTRNPEAHRKGETVEVRLDRASARRDTIRISLVG